MQLQNVAFPPASAPRRTNRSAGGPRGRWTEMPRGGHFAAHGKPQLLADDVLAFLAEL